MTDARDLRLLRLLHRYGKSRRAIYRILGISTFPNGSIKVRLSRSDRAYCDYRREREIAFAQFKVRAARDFIAERVDASQPGPAE